MLLSNHPLFETSDLDEARGRMADLLGPHVVEAQDHDASFELAVNQVALDGCGLTVVACNARLRLTTEPAPQHVHVVIALAGHVEFAARGYTVACEPGLAFVASRSQAVTAVVDGRTMLAIVSLDRAALERQVTHRLRKPLRHPLTLSPAWPAAQGAATFGRLVVSLCDEVDRADSSLASSPHAMGSVVLTLRTLLLEQHEHMLTAALRGDDRGGLQAWQVRLAEQFILGNLEWPVSIADVAREVGVSVRSLTAAFKRVRGDSPRAFLARVRMERARQDLLRGDAASVSRVARHWGFLHPGRFSDLYHRQFGEFPSQTLTRSRWAAPHTVTPKR